MDIYCPTCGEPWDMDTLHEEIAERITSGDLASLPDNGNYRGEQYEIYRKAYDKHYDAVRSDFYKRGCKAMYAFSGGEPSWCKPSTDSKTQFRAQVSSAMFDLLGDDIDGVAAMMDDYMYLAGE